MVYDLPLVWWVLDGSWLSKTYPPTICPWYDRSWMGLGYTRPRVLTRSYIAGLPAVEPEVRYGQK